MHAFKNIALILFSSILILAGCTEVKQESKQSQSKKTTEQQSLIKAKVEKVVDGDTISVQMDGSEETVRMLLIDTPETKHPDKPVQPYGPEASQFAKEKLSGKQIKLEIGTTKRDKYDRILAYVYVNGEMYNKLVVQNGLARVAYVYPPNDKYVEELRKAEQDAKKSSRGIWSNPDYVQEDGFHDEAIKDKKKQPDSSQSNISLPYAPDGPDRDCGDFQKQIVAQAFFEAAGGPSDDPHRLDRDQDGVVCETLP
ncbi:thermonuclease family protein [Pontibacillus sp. HMF3514]|uniref:thermonuclease family protein n=1 Tax=Pontibacillus sp. HMF3514 TaxID=2692425 RepID=UPI0013203999|nr:thermonuclease family protein [Pontibacillus sp. HMF3514]QHE51919.1 nuclease [Pontibacillus sp. HMF3514]